MENFLAIVIRLDTLLDMSLSSEITRNEYIAKKKKLIEKKTDIEQDLRGDSDGSDSWFELALSIVNQATTIPNILSSTDSTVLVDFFKKVGLNRTLRADKVVFQPHNGWKALYDAPRRRASTKVDARDNVYRPFVLLGSAGGIRTCDLPVNSRLLYR